MIRAAARFFPRVHGEVSYERRHGVGKLPPACVNE